MSFEDKRNKGKFFLPDIGASFLIIELFDLIVDGLINKLLIMVVT